MLEVKPQGLGLRDPDVQIARCSPQRGSGGCYSSCSSSTGAYSISFNGYDHLGLRRTRMTESPRRNILLMKRSLFTGVEPFFPFPVLGIYRGEW